MNGKDEVRLRQGEESVDQKKNTCDEAGQWTCHADVEHCLARWYDGACSDNGAECSEVQEEGERRKWEKERERYLDIVKTCGKIVTKLVHAEDEKYGEGVF